MKCLYLLIYFQLLSNVLMAQTVPRFWDDVQTIKSYDKIYQVPPQPIVFVGSSSIRKWDNLQQTFGAYNVLNRGIGGAIINDISFYLKDIVFPYNPRKIVLYVGENDLPDNSATPDTILNRTKNLVITIRKALPNVPIVYISMKPSPSRVQFIDKAITSNRLIKEYLSKEQNMSFVDVFSRMLTKDKKPRPELFVEDMLHMNLEGYAIWEKAVEKHIKN